MFAPYNCIDKPTLGHILPDKKSVPLGLGSAFAAIPPPPPPLPLEQRPPDSRYLWDHSTRLHAALHPTSTHPHHGLGTLSGNPGLELSPLVAGARLGTSPIAPAHGELTAPHPTYRIPPYMEHLYQSLHTSPQASLRGISPLERAGLSITGDYIGMSGIAATRLSDPHLIPASLTSTDLAFSLDGSRLTSPRPSLRQSRKRALSSSPYSDSFDINSMIRFSPNSLTSIMNGGSRSSSGSGSYGHLSAGAISPALGVPPTMGAATTQLQQLQAHLMRGATLPGSPFLPPSPLLQHTPAALPPHQSIFSLTSQPQPIVSQSQKPEIEKISSLVPTTLSEDEKSKTKKDTPITSNGTNRNGVPVSVGVSEGGTGGGTNGTSAPAGDEDNLKEEPDDFVETNCNWKQCSKEFNTQDELVKHINNDHIHANKKSFVCRWKDCSRDEKPFKAQYMLVVHMRRHTGEKPHRCTFEGCFKAYSRLENLKTHLRSHTGEKPYMCEYPGCTKAFSNASDRAKHQNRTHSNEKPYVCKAPGCTKRYTDPSSLRKHVKTVHGADFYASKKHKGNDHHGGSNGNGNGNPKEGSGNPEGSPHSDGGKGASSSSPSVKSEDPTSPGHGHSPAMVVGGSTPMDQSKLLDVAISDNNVSTTGIYEGGGGGLPDEWDTPDDDLDASVDLPILGSLNGGGGGPVLASHVALQEGNLRNRLKTRLQKKGLTTILPSVPGVPRKGSGNGTVVSELSQRINALKMNAAGQTTPQQVRKNLLDMQCRSGQQTILQGNRRDSNSTVSTYYGSMRSDSSHPLSRRGSELSQASFGSINGRQAILSSPYDPISCGSSRRSSENSAYNSPAFGPMGTHLNRFQRRPMGHPEMYNTSNLVVQTQNMSLSQENLQNWSSNMSNASGGIAPTLDSSSSGYFGCAGPMGAPTTTSRDSSRRASDPGRQMDRGFLDPTQRMHKFNSYTNFNYRNPMGMRTSMTPPIYSHPNQGLQLDQVGEDESIESKLILPDDMVNYLNQNGNNEMKAEAKESQPRTSATPNSIYNQQISSPAYASQNLTSPCYPNQGVSSPYPNQPLASPAPGYQYPPQPSSGYSVPPSPAHPYTHAMNSPAPPFNAPHPSPAPPMGYNTPMPPMYPNHQNMNGYYPAQGNSQVQQMTPTHQQQQLPMPTQIQGQQTPQQQSQSQQPQYNNSYGQYPPHQMMPHNPLYGGMMQGHARFQHGSCPPQTNGSTDMASNSYGPVHICGHLAPPNLAAAAYQAPCSGCQTRGGNGYNNDTNHYSSHYNMGWQGNQSGMGHLFGNPYCGQNSNVSGAHHMGMAGYQEGGNPSQYNMGAVPGVLGMQYPSSLASDVQCQDVSQSTQSRLAAKAKLAKSEQKPKEVNGASKSQQIVDEATKQDVKDVQAKTEVPKMGDTKPVDTKTDSIQNANNFMRTDTYQRTLKYVQECQNWNTSTVKEEVSSTTDQKPVLNANGTVMDYNPPQQGPKEPHTEPNNNLQTPSTQVPYDSNAAAAPAITQAPSHPPVFCPPMPAALPEAPNMVINDMTSSLTSLQKENKYLQLLQ